MLEWMGKKKVVNHHNDVPFHVLERKARTSWSMRTPVRYLAGGLLGVGQVSLSDASDLLSYGRIAEVP